GVAVLGSLLTTRFGAGIGPAVEGLPAPARAAAETGRAGALQVAGRLPADAGEALADTARTAFVDGFALAGVVSAALALAVGVGAYLLLPRTVPSGPPEDAPEVTLADADE